MCFKIDRVKFTIFALFYFVVEGNFPSTWGPYIWRGGFMEGFFITGLGGGGLYLEGLIFGILHYFKCTVVHCSHTVLPTESANMILT